MIRGLMKSTSLFALASAAGLAMSMATANAADLGGNCCADLEERVAELEATTARKGNRKVSLEVFGNVNKTILHWNDGGKSNTYLGIDNTNFATRFGFQGNATINPEWKAGYRILIDVTSGARSSSVDQLGEEKAAGGTTGFTDDHALRMRDANVWLESNRLGRITLGRLTVSGPQSVIDLGGIGNIASGSLSLLGGAMRFRDSAGTLTTRTISNGTDAAADFNNRVDGIKWDSPTFAGFVFGASVGEATKVDRADDIGTLWAVNLRYANEFNGVRVAAAIGYEVSKEEETMTSVNRTDSKNLGLSGSLMHVATGLFVQSQWNRFDRGNDDLTSDRSNQWLVQAGVSRNWFGIGNTALYGEVGRANNGFDTFFARGTANNFNGDKVSVWGLGVTQNIDAAAMQLYAGYRNFSATDGLAPPLQDISIFAVGARINF